MPAPHGSGVPGHALTQEVPALLSTNPASQEQVYPVAVSVHAAVASPLSRQWLVGEQPMTHAGLPSAPVPFL
jgi:hypothetical protein